jgi:putative phosphoribosyl transferase
MTTGNIHTLPELSNCVHVFSDREHAGKILAGMLQDYRNSEALVLGIPAGGVPVAATIATQLGLSFNTLPVSKILYPWTTEAGFGAVAFDGTEWINEDAVRNADLNADTVQTATKEAQEKVQRRRQRFHGTHPFPNLKDRSVILVDDGIAAGSTIRAGILALQKAQAGKIIIAVPTGHDSSFYPIAKLVDAIYCANLREGYSFAVASAYQIWTDVSEDEVATILEQIRKENV